MTEIEKGAARLKADFNNVRDGATIVARFDFAHGVALPDDGDVVEVHDPEGNRCFGEVVARVDDERFRVRLNYATWQDAVDEQESAPVTDLMDALRRSVLEARAEARSRGVDTTPERDEVDDFTIQVA